MYIYTHFSWKGTPVFGFEETYLACIMLIGCRWWLWPTAFSCLRGRTWGNLKLLAKWSEWWWPLQKVWQKMSKCFFQEERCMSKMQMIFILYIINTSCANTILLLSVRSVAWNERMEDTIPTHSGEAQSWHRNAASQGGPIHKWGYNPYKRPDKWVTRVISPL